MESWNDFQNQQGMNQDIDCQNNTRTAPEQWLGQGGPDLIEFGVGVAANG